MLCHSTLNELGYIGEVGDGTVVVEDVRVEPEFFEDGRELSVFESGGEYTRLEGLIDDLGEDREECGDAQLVLQQGQEIHPKLVGVIMTMG